MQMLFSNAHPEELIDFLQELIAAYKGSTPPRKRLRPLVDADGNVPSPLKRLKSAKVEHAAHSPNTLEKLTRDLSDEQMAIFQMVQQGKSVFFTGGAGTGKSFLFKRLVRSLDPNTSVATASTGAASHNIGGVTLHSFSGILSGDMTFAQAVKAAKRKIGNWKRCKTLLIDEVSMIDGEYLDLLDAVARSVKNSTQPFGGLQVIICGDFLQLPPVCKNRDVPKKFAFEAECWPKLVPHCFELRRIYRQKDDHQLIRVLRLIRVGVCNEEVQKVLRSTQTNNKSIASDLKPTELCTHVAEVEDKNEKFLTDLSGEEVAFTALDNYYTEGDRAALTSQLDHLCPAPTALVLKLGAQVMMCRNVDFKAGLVNGARGVVVGFNTTADRFGVRLPIVRFASGAEKVVHSETWAHKVFGREVAARTQVPLRLSWAISVHKSQGMTIDLVNVNISKVFEFGQAYVALSRARTLEGLKVTGFTAANIRANPKALQFYKKLRQATKLAETQKENVNK
ncbi:hypothetical protein SARC_06646 [Sphaeroforma arctica JP610]|uniref:ATP-dependent DNA helicase n=1 Tax=Sphaeroforma arctica JP610 TaxID=667725 RepID=A0A0L0FVZ2_9EUKA|nr:hypothetical protein SARC_06646 [Sphaeroforma arctica JP610]KNC81015.1 hypothetical protein SARC_06646 [Sphaeroforma arctica JP610]|eukprot:XP_014154917.1 hypothetical protein SARC_06646 [Sphaeroforma arctica JP610]